MLKKIKNKYKINIKKGETVKIITGKSKGAIGKIKKIISKKNKIIIENINLAKKHLRPKKEGENGKIIEIEVPIHVSNVKKYHQ
uniref:Large ribosomal subunit protein uL24c n=1 Tax=Plocamium cartilagineum TaxID=31452 RepID=A0A1C9CI45_PLOCA|nr:ribosomal protein L24 [Plocamium cartilagineum]AOM68022.1 ribosomal protein L24 [Plocamium cartilagineum]